MEIIENNFIFSDDINLIDVKTVHHYLSTQSYWAKGIPLKTVQKSISNSLCFGVYKDGKQIGFSRWVTDKATFAYLCDVYIEEEFRGLGLSKKLMSFMSVSYTHLDVYKRQAIGSTLTLVATGLGCLMDFFTTLVTDLSTFFINLEASFLANLTFLATCFLVLETSSILCSTAVFT